MAETTQSKLNRCMWPGCRSFFPDTPKGRQSQSRHEKRQHPFRRRLPVNFTHCVFPLDNERVACKLCLAKGRTSVFTLPDGPRHLLRHILQVHKGIPKVPRQRGSAINIPNAGLIRKRHRPGRRRAILKGAEISTVSNGVQQWV